MDWSYSNLETLFDLGRKAGKLFLDGDGSPEHPAHNVPEYKDVFNADSPRYD